MSHKPGGRLILLSARPAVTISTLKRAATNFAAWWTQAWRMWTVCLRLLPNSVTTAIWTQAILRLSPVREPLSYWATHLTVSVSVTKQYTASRSEKNGWNSHREHWEVTEPVAHCHSATYIITVVVMVFTSQLLHTTNCTLTIICKTQSIHWLHSYQYTKVPK